jgi:hypothetical protein
MHLYLLAAIAALPICSCSALRTTPSRSGIKQTTAEVEAALAGKSRAEVEAYFGRKPDGDYGQTSWVYRGNFFEPGEKRVCTSAVVVFSHFEPDKVWSVGFDCP